MQVLIIVGGRIPGVGDFAPGDSPDLPLKVATDLILAKRAISTHRNDTSPPAPTITIDVDEDLVILSDDESGGL